MKYINLDLKKIPDYGITLIEASAGTGKTFTIIILYLRLILNIGIKKTYSRPLLISEILIVTFTEASKNELKNRLYKKICQLYDMCINKKNEIHELKKIINDVKDFKKTIQLLKTAKKNINLIMIYTLHGFFFHILNEQKFLCKQMIPDKILLNIQKLQLESTKDFWRKYVCDVNKNVTKLILKKWPNPYKLFNHINTWINQLNISFKHKFNKKTNLCIIFNNIIEIINVTKKIWNEKKKKIKNLIFKMNLNKKIYNKKNLAKWFLQINQWSQKIKNNYSVPGILKYFKFSNIKNIKLFKNDKKYIFFKNIEKIFKNYNLFFEYFVYTAVKKITKIVQNKKKETNRLEFNDLNKILWKEIKSKNSIIKKNIINKYTISIIDECQDIDDIQFNIFYTLYNNIPNKSLILFGDPKQSIYSFRGSNIFSYLKFKKKIKKHFILKKNFRSSKYIVAGINTLFSRIKNPFVFNKIDFQPSTIHQKNKKTCFIIDNIKQPAFNFVFQHKKVMTTDEYYCWIAKKCAYSIYTWLSKKSNKSCFIKLNNNKIRHITHNDITILVKNKYEAQIIKKELKKNGLQSIYTSHKNNIFHTVEAKEIMWILDSIIDLSNTLKFQKLLVTRIFKKNIFDIQLINNQEKIYTSLFLKLKNYYVIWNTTNITNMIYKIITDFSIQVNNTYSQKNKINIKKITKICEILEKKNQIITNKFLLTVWFKKKILQNNIEHNKIIDISEKEEKTINIVTIYKAKGLEYPITWIPFFSNFKIPKNNIFFCKKKLKKIIDLKNNKKNLFIHKQELLSEDLRLLYVALTRSIIHCNIGIAAIQKKKTININNNIDTDCHKSSLGFLIQKGKKYSLCDLKKELYSLQNNKIFNIKHIKNKNKKYFKIQSIKTKKILQPKLLKKIINPWTKISFSKIISYNIIYKKNYIQEKIKENKLLLQNKKNKSSKLNIHNFPSGKEYGIYLHDILKKIEFNKINNIKKIINKLNFLSLSKVWINKLFIWICNILTKSIDNKNLSLNKIKKNEHLKEVKFTIPIKKYIDINQLNIIIKNFDSLSQKCKNINLENISGVLTGIIDLIFIWENKYYIIDYKSNWLGSNYDDYNINNLQIEIIKHRYDIQYQIYSLAIHRYLSKKIKNYNYNLHFGGVFYLFIRALNKKNNNGIFFIKPSYLLIYHLDNLLNGKFYDT
ncbi:RecBCD enzyme subunit RecB [Buchnera aphidicola (Cinara kochiana kochiana)]|uniref:RecBCD enzyme subunit RecB n=1 Tax=Buchnera aphidicola (Cinara kochiana kochiana) TaxID=2518976 RepID=A0A451D5W3_9GAMM|nr:exodeoxyribonuclease V subunit beta [Buchnera aphidicola]VFP81196.1 RecBCD enzyme subunit RecB [Buchnera aphidicola (Cinara kochiana kochiana)]